MKKIVFDLGGVVLTNYWGWRQKDKFSKEFGLDRLKTRDYGKQRSKEINSGKISERSYFEGLFDYQDSPRKVDEAINFLRSQSDTIDDVLDIVKLLSEKYGVYALTNEIKESAEFRDKKFSLSDYFERIFVSSVIGHVKPNKEIYEFVVMEIGCEPEDIIYIDNVEGNLHPADEIGMETIHFINSQQLRKQLKEKGVDSNYILQ